MDSNKARHDGKYVGDDITEITKKVRANYCLTDFEHMSGISYRTDSWDFVDVCFGDFVDVGHLAGNSYPKEPARVSPLMDSNKAHEEICHDGIYVGDDITEIQTKLPANSYLTDFGHLSGCAMVSLQMDSNKACGDDITEIPTKVPANSYLTNLRDFVDVGHLSGSSYPKEPDGVGPLMDSSQAREEICHDGKCVGDDITEIPTKLPANSYLTDFGHLSGSSYPTDLGDFVDVGHLSWSSYPRKPARLFPLMDSNKAHEEICHYGKYVGGDMTEIGSSYPTDFVDLGDCGHLKELPEICHDGKEGKYVGDDITEIPTKLPANSSLRDFEDLGDFMDLEESEAALSCPYLLIVDYIRKISETYTEGDGPGTDSSHDSKYIVEDITVIPRLFLPKQPVISFPLLSLLKQLLIYDDIYIDKISETYSEGHDGKYLVLAITEIPTKLHVISFRELLMDLSDLRELTAQVLISSSIIDEGIIEIPTKLWVRVSQDGEGMSWIKTELSATSYQPLLKDLRELAISFPPLPPLKLLPQLRIDFSIIDEETYSNSEGDVPGTESRHDCKYVVLDITEIPTMLRDGVFQDDEGTSWIKTEPYQQLLTKLPLTTFPRPFLPKPPGISFPRSFLLKLRAISLTKQPLISSSIVDDDIDKISETNSEVDILGTESRREKNPEQVARRDKDLPEYSLYSSLRDGKEGETRVLAAAKGAAFLAHKSLSTAYWHSHEKVFIERPDVLERVKQDLLLALTKFALTIYDMEDFDRIVFKEDIKAERMKFLHDLDQTSTKTTTEAILDIASGKMNFGKYCRLLERDVGNILELRERYFESSFHWNLEDYVADDYTWSSEDVNIPEPVIESTIAVMKEMSPLKRNCAMHLMMELVLHSNCNCITDTLFHEFWRDIDVSRLEVFTIVSPNRLRRLLLDIIDTMSFLIRRRMRELCHSTFSATFPLVFGAFGDWSRDVIDVVQLADCERRWEGDNFIRNRHLLLGLLSSQITGSVQEFGRFRDDRKESSMRHVYEIYMVTEHVARMFGVNEIKLEHLFLAIMVVNLGINHCPQWIEDLQQTREGLAVEEYIPVVQERMFYRFRIDFANLDTKAFVGNGISNERKKWDASMAIDKVAVFFKEREKFVGREERFEEGRRSVGCPLWNSVRMIKQLCKSHELPMIWENGGEEDSEGKN